MYVCIKYNIHTKLCTLYIYITYIYISHTYLCRTIFWFNFMAKIKKATQHNNNIQNFIYFNIKTLIICVCTLFINCSHSNIFVPLNRISNVLFLKKNKQLKLLKLLFVVLKNIYHPIDIIIVFLCLKQLYNSIQNFKCKCLKTYVYVYH